MKKIIFILAVAILGCLIPGCGPSTAERALAEAIFVDTEVPNPYLKHADSMPPGGVRLRINKHVYSLPRQLNDSNWRHLESAKAIGISPIQNIHDLYNLRRPIVQIVSCRDFFVDSLTYSYPFLVPEAADLLHEIGHRFNDSLAMHGGGDYRIKVTSILRTRESVAKLRRRNSNATDSSAHQFGTTFDISYLKFICDSAHTVPRTQEDLKLLLGEILVTLRDSGKCWVKYERKQSCFHITAREPKENTATNVNDN